VPAGEGLCVCVVVGGAASAVNDQRRCVSGADVKYSTFHHRWHY
jgi:hypothetical protein